MLSIIIKRRTIILTALSLAGLTILFLGWRGDLLEKRNTVSEVQDTRSATGMVNIESVGWSVAEEKSATGETGEDFFVEYRLERERTRGQQVEWLREVINNADLPTETRQKAQEHLMAISRFMAKEVELENLIRAKGYKDAVVLVDERAVTVIVAADGMSSAETTGIADLVSRGTGVEVQNIVIITRQQK